MQQVFNVGQLRRSKYSKEAEVSGERPDQSSTYFDSTNKQAQRDREKLASQCLENLISWLKEGGNVGIHGSDFSSGSLRSGANTHEFKQMRRTPLARDDKRWSIASKRNQV